jgi:hypothetical protein
VQEPESDAPASQDAAAARAAGNPYEDKRWVQVRGPLFLLLWD